MQALPPSPPPVIIQGPNEPVQPRLELVTFTPETLRCADGALRPVRLEGPLPVISYRYETSLMPAVTSYRLHFNVGEDGRPRTIRRASGTTSGYLNTTDLAPALAASMFPRDVARRDCTVTYAAEATAIAGAPRLSLYAFASLSPAPSVPAPVWALLAGTDSTCRRGAGSPRSINYPLFETIEQSPGTQSWTYIRHDVDLEGRPRAVRIVASSGNAALDRAGLAAVAKDRWAPGEGRVGCSFFFHRSGRDSRRPELPDATPPDRGERPGCTLDEPSMQRLRDPSNFPRGFARREIQGVAAVSYATAPWGAVGDVVVIASEPDEAFGQAALQALRDAHVAPSAAGQRGCVRRFRFNLAADGQASP